MNYTDALLAVCLSLLRIPDGLARRRKKWTLSRFKRLVSRSLVYAVVIFFGLIMVAPFYYMIITSVKRIQDVAALPISFIPTRPTLQPYQSLLKGTNYLRFMWNSLIVASTTTLGTIFFCSLAGYTFAKHHFPHKEKLFMLLLTTMMIPGSVLLVPGFLLMRDFGWLNTFLPLIVPGLAGAFGIFLARQFIADIPNALLDAGKIDGATDFQTYWHIILPLSRPLLATLGILTFLGNWNSFLGPLIMLLDEEKYTLPLGLSLLQGRYVSIENVQMAGAALAIIPVLVLFLIFQNQIVKSLSTSGLKG
ncbi:carbohydrate ABC transporter permease [candidate division KSB1 bacterium]|nr:carbohydrate ABC transporter permease [candidate division KSB1 bacterium]